MNRMAAILAACLLPLAFAGCAQQEQSGAPQTEGASQQQSSQSAKDDTEGSPLASVASEGQKRALDEDAAEQPVAVGCSKETEGGVHSGFLYGEEGVRKLREYLQGIVVGGPSEVEYSDAGASYSFYYPDGTRVSFDMEPDQINVDGQYREVVDEPRLGLDFPGNDTELGIDPPSGDVRGFFEKADESLPVEAAVSGAAGSSSTTDASVVEDLVEQFRTMELTGALDAQQMDRVRQGKDAKPSEYTFKFPDGSSHTFKFEGGYLLIDFPDGLGTWGYFTPEMPRIGS